MAKDPARRDRSAESGAQVHARRRGLRSIPGGSAEPAFPRLDRIIHERLRLGIVSALAANPVLAFADLKRLLDTTDGNLAVHARKLEEAGYIEARKGFEERMPRTEYRLTPSGRRALERYLEHMERIIRSARARRG